MFLDAEYKGTLAIVTAAFITGCHIYLSKIGTMVVPKVLFVSATLTLAGFTLLLTSIILGKKEEVISQKKYFPKFLWIGIVSMSIPTTMVVYGVSLSLVSNSFLLQVEIIYSMLLSYILLKERIIRQQIVLAISSFSGVALVLTDGVIKTINIGDILFLVAPIFLQLGHIVAKDILRKVDPMVAAMYRLLIGGLALSLVSFLLGWNILSIFSVTFEVTVIILLVSFGYSLGVSLWYYGIKYVNLSKATPIITTFPLVSTILAILTLGEALSIVKIFGISLVFLSALKLSRIRSSLRK